MVLDKNHERAKGVVADLQYGATLSPTVELRAGDYADLADGRMLVIVTGPASTRKPAAPRIAAILRAG